MTKLLMIGLGILLFLSCETELKVTNKIEIKNNSEEIINFSISQKDKSTNLIKLYPTAVISLCDLSLGKSSLILWNNKSIKIIKEFVIYDNSNLYFEINNNDL